MPLFAPDITPYLLTMHTPSLKLYNLMFRNVMVNEDHVAVRVPLERVSTSRTVPLPMKLRASRTASGLSRPGYSRATSSGL
ncbi:MAG: hypothetical protein QXQ53_06490, partial [Candidatus Methanosuratincola sp.]